MPEDEKRPDEAKAEEKLEEKPETPGEGTGPDQLNKIVDEDWKAEARREKEKLQAKIEEEETAEREARKLPPADFQHFISGVAAQVLMQLGELENPMAGEKRVDLESARYSIDILQMLEEKTKGNLTPEEQRYLTAALHDLRMRFVGAATGKGKDESEGQPPPPGA